MIADPPLFDGALQLIEALEVLLPFEYVEVPFTPFGAVGAARVLANTI